MPPSKDDINFQRLIAQCKRVAGDDVRPGLRRFESYVDHLEKIYVRLQGEGSLDEETLMQYGRELHFLKELVKTEQKKSLPEKIAAANLLPTAMESTGAGGQGTADLRQVKARTRAVYAADLRRQLLGSSEGDSNGVAGGGVRLRSTADTFDTDNADIDAVLKHHHDIQSRLADEFLQLTRNLKQNITIAGHVVRDDNQTLGRLERTADVNRERLSVEAARLEQHAYRSWMDCGVAAVLLLVCVTFVAMVLVMRLFVKPSGA